MNLFILLYSYIVFQPIWASPQIDLSSPQSISECEKAYQNFNHRFSTLQRQYATISNTPVLKENAPSWTWGRNQQAVYLLHGFIGTPAEMSKIGNELHSLGYTVINDLIPGHGADGFVANAFGEATWTRHVELNIKQIRRCFDNIHFVGFSTGGLLIHQYLRNHDNDFKAKSVTLYSPFYRPHWQFAELLKTAARLFTPIVLTKPLYEITHFPDIKIAVLKPANYLQQLPLDGAQFVLNLGETFNKDIANAPGAESSTPILLFVSDTDQVMDLKTTIQNISADFTDVTVVRFQKQYVPHHLMRPEVSSVAPRVLQRTVDFISSH